MEAALNLLNDEMVFESVDSVETTDNESLIKKEVEEMDDFEQMVLKAASAATSIIEKNKAAEKEIDGIDIAAVAASIVGRENSKENIEKLIKSDIVKPKKERKPREKKERVEGEKAPKRDLFVKAEDKYGEVAERPVLEKIAEPLQKVGDHYIIKSNDMKTIKGQLKEIKNETKTRLLEVFIDSSYFFTKFHKMNISEPLQIESVGMKYINITYDKDDWAISPERQDSSFTLRVVPVIETKTAA